MHERLRHHAHRPARLHHRVLHADAGTIVELVVDWNRCFPMACLDPVRGFITLMAPSRLMRILPGSPTTS